MSTNDAPAQASVEAACDRVWKAAITALPEKAWAVLNDLSPPELTAIFDTLACAALAPPPTVGAEDEAEVTRIRDWLLERNREHLYEKGLMLRRHAGDAERFLDTAILLSKLATRPSPSAVEVRGDVIAKIRKVAADFDAYAKAYDEAGQKDLALIATAKAFGVSCALEMLCPEPVSCIASEKGGL